MTNTDQERGRDGSCPLLTFTLLYYESIHKNIEIEFFLGHSEITGLKNLVF